MLVSAACGSNPEQRNPPGDTGGAAGGSNEGGGGEGGDGSIVPITGVGGSGGDDNPCGQLSCRADQHCEIVDGEGRCVDNTCDDLTCGPTEICQVPPDGGARCVDISCRSDLECPINQYCNGTICVDDACAAGSRACDGEELLQCDSNGSGLRALFTCGGDAYFESQCTDDGDGRAGCPCEDDWDCPAHATCEVGFCTGTGAAPTCSLPAEPFLNALPKLEFQWGGTSIADSSATGSPFPTSAQTVMTPLVANLDDDNGDGLINELDFPEIIFTTFCNSDIARDGVLRAIHGGGPKKGRDYFAVLGDKVWREGDPLDVPYSCADATLNSTAALAVGDLDADGVPEIVAITEASGNPPMAGLHIFSNTGELRFSSNRLWAGYPEPAPAIANLDGKGLPEIVVGRHVFTLQKDSENKLSILDHFEGDLMHGLQRVTQLGPIPCIANLVGDARLEIIAGSTVYALPTPPPGVNSIAECAESYPEEEEEANLFCSGKLRVVWDGQTVNSNSATAGIPDEQRDGFCAVADILGRNQEAAPGPENPLDGLPEVILVNNAYVFVLNGQDGKIKRRINMMEVLASTSTRDGGAPNIDDFDGDGFPELATAFGRAYVVLDLQEPTPECPAWPTRLVDGVEGPQGNPPRTPNGKQCSTDEDCSLTGAAMCNQKTGTCVCYHNGWMRLTEDNSSRATGSSVFDFNGDGAAEVIYNDECYFRIYDGVTGSVLFKEHSPSRTRTEYPVVADVDNDGNAEIVFATSNESGFCDEGFDYNNGLEVWGEHNDLWVSARRIWNQHAYHVTNVLESGGIPLQEPENWKEYGGRAYNTYRSNPRTYGIAPDLALSGIQISSPDAVCGELSDNIDITVRVENLGDLRVGPGVVIRYYGEWAGADGPEPLLDEGGAPLQAEIQTSIEPHSSLMLTVSYSAANNVAGELPARLRAVVDEDDAERECNEDNNAQTFVVEAGDARPDLRVQIGTVDRGGCPSPRVPTTVFNGGSAPVSNVKVRYYAGDPAQGGTPLHEEIVPGPIEPGMSTSFTANLDSFPLYLSILIHGVVDPDNEIDECNDGNNGDAAENKVECIPPQ